MALPQLPINHGLDGHTLDTGPNLNAVGIVYLVFISLYTFALILAVTLD